MPEIQVALLRGDRVDPDVQWRTSLPVNAMPVINPIFGVEGFVHTHPGYKKYVDVPGKDRNGIYNERLGEHLRVSGDRLVRIDPNGSILDLGLVEGLGASIYEQASMPYSFQSQAIITGLRMYLYRGGLTRLEEVTDPDLGAPIDGCWIDGYYFLTDGENLYHTDIDDETSIDPLKFATSEFSPDPTRGVAKTPDNQVMVFNRYTTEFFRNAATEQFAFTRVAGKASKVGIIGTHCKTELNGEFYCLGSAKFEAPTMLIIGAGRADNFSTREVDEILNGYAEAELARTIMDTRIYEQQRLVYAYLLRHTLVFNVTVAEQQGKEFAWSILRHGVDDEPWRVINQVYDPRVDKWLGGDRYYPQVNELQFESATQDETGTEVILYTPFVVMERASIDEVEIQTIPGQGVGAVRAFLSLTFDGQNYSREWSLEYSEQRGERETRFIFRRLGYVREWVGFKLRVVSENRVTFANMVIRYG